MHDRLFQNQSNLSITALKQHASDLGLDTRVFNGCLDSGKHGADWKRTKALAEESYGITGTPAFIINGIPIFGAAPLEEFTQIIDDELKRMNSSAGPVR